MPSADSFRPVAPGHEGDVFQVILAVEERLSRKLDEQTTELRAEFDERLRDVELAILEFKDARIELRGLNQKLDQLLESDKKQNQELLSLQQREQTVQIADASAKEASTKVEQIVAKKLNWRTAIIGVLTMLLSLFGEAVVRAIGKALNQ